MGESAPRPWTWRLGHYGWIIGPTALLAAGLLGMARLLIGGLPGQIVDVAWGLALLPAATVSMVASVMHSRKLCERCIAEIPANPAAAAERLRPWMLIGHATSGSRLAILLIIAWIWSSFALRAYVGEQTTAGRALFLLTFAAPMAALLVGNMLHARLQPWCPRCRRGGGGGGRGPSAPDRSPDGLGVPV